MELSFCDLRAKEVVNICDGRKLGNIIDLIIDCRYARVIGIVVPFDKGFFSFFKSKQDIFIPWHQICRIGKDVILVDISPNQLPEIYSTKTTKHQSASTLSQSQGHNTVIDLGYNKDLNNSPINNPGQLLNNPNQSYNQNDGMQYNQSYNSNHNGFYDNPSYINNQNQNNNQNNNTASDNINFNNFTKS